MQDGISVLVAAAMNDRRDIFHLLKKAGAVLDLPSKVCINEKH